MKLKKKKKNMEMNDNDDGHSGFSFLPLSFIIGYPKLIAFSIR